MLQRAWDRELSRKPVLLLLIGSDLSMMEALTSYGRPFHQRGSDMPIGPLNVANVASMTGLGAAESLKHGCTVLGAIGSGEWTFTNIARAAGGIAHSTLTRAADLLVDKRIVAAELPVSLQPSKERRYRITDSYLRFYFAFLGSHLAEIDRMRSDLTLERIRRGWAAWRGRAVEPIAKELLFLGSIKWLENAPFDAHDLVALQRHRDRMTAEPIPLLAVSRSGCSTERVDAVFGPEELLHAWTN